MGFSNTFALINDEFPQYYELLGVSADATRRDISRAYRPLALSEHPDKNGSTPAANERFANINQARDVLTDPDTRKEHDPVPRAPFDHTMPRMPDDHNQKFHCAVDILWEILRFSGCGYIVVKRSFETIYLKTRDEATAEMNRLMRKLDKVHMQMLSTERAVTSMGTQIVGRTADATTLLKAMEQLCREWEGLLKLPAVIVGRMDAIFRDGPYEWAWYPQGEHYPIESWKQGSKNKKKPKKATGRKGSKGSQSSSDGIT